MQAQFQRERLSGSSWVGTTNSSLVPSSRVSEPATISYQYSGLTAGSTYRWRVRGWDGLVYGDWSSWCQFTVDIVGPKMPPVVTSAGPYVEKEWGGGLGVPGTFTFDAPPNPDIPAEEGGVTKYMYAFNTVLPATCPGSNSNGVGCVTTTAGAPQNRTYTPAIFGPTLLQVASVDAAGNPGRYASSSSTCPGGRPRAGGCWRTTAPTPAS